MTVEANKVVSIHYTLTNDAGELLDTSSGSEPLFYIHGSGNIVPGLERAMEGKKPGDAFDVDVSSEEGYGARNDEMIQKVPKTAFQNVEDLEIGMSFQAQTGGGMHIFIITDIDDEHVTADGNHPLAGENLHFKIEVVDIREPTKEELSHGHVHGPGGHHHH